MNDLLLNLSPQTALPETVAGAGFGPLFVAGTPITVPDTRAGAVPSFGELFRNLQVPVMPERTDARTASTPLSSDDEQASEATPGDEDVAVRLELHAEIPATTPQPQQIAVTLPAPAHAAANTPPAPIGASVEIPAQVSAPQVAAPVTSSSGTHRNPIAVSVASTLGSSSVLTEARKTNPWTDAPHAQLASQSIASATATLATLTDETIVPVATERPAAPPQQALAALLQERLQVQIAERSEHAVVRLDPPSLGTIEISIRHEGGQLQVHLRASHGEVARQLHAIGENLRQDLLQRHETVSVHVFDSTRDGERRRERQMPWQDTPGRALDESGDEPASFAMNVANE
jgi:flagellar hook-length control protein FliK